MARSITVLVTTVGNSPNHAGIEVNTANKTWVKAERSGADKVFKAKTGPYRVLGGSAFEMLRVGGGARVGRLQSFDPDTVTDGATGQGLSDDTGSALSWKVNGIVDI